MAVANQVQTFAIGVGETDDGFTEELAAIAQHRDRVYTVEHFDDLSDIVSNLTIAIHALRGKINTNCELGNLKLWCILQTQPNLVVKEWNVD